MIKASDMWFHQFVAKFQNYTKKDRRYKDTPFKIQHVYQGIFNQNVKCYLLLDEIINKVNQIKNKRPHKLLQKER